MTILRPLSPLNLLLILAISSSPHATTAFTTPSVSSSSSSWRQWSSSYTAKTTPFSPAFIITTTPLPTTSTTSLFSTTSPTTTTTTEGGFIETELRGAAMKLHTKSQAPREGQQPEQQRPSEPYTPTHADYLQFLIDSQHVYTTFENLINNSPQWQSFRSTGMERTIPLETDIKFLMVEYQLERPSVGDYGLSYADEIQRLADKDDGSVPELMCHYYNWYFAHTAGGRMIGKKMSGLLLNGTTLAFYKWDDLNKIKSTVKNDIETMVSSWTREEKDRCVGQTEAAFRLGGGINRYLSQKQH